MIVRIQVIKVYDVEVDTDDEDEALAIAGMMPSTKIEAIGKFIDCTTDFAEIASL